jgi:hypothetical protein
MKRTLLMTLFVFGLCLAVQAGPCTTAALSVYDAGSFTCNIGALDFSNFSYHPTGINTPSDLNVEVDPITGVESGFEFFAGWSAGAGNVQDSAIKYTVTCDGCSITDLVLSMEGAGASGDSFLNIAETSGGVEPGLLIGQSTSTSIVSETEIIPPVGTLNLTKDILLNGGTTGFGAGVSQVNNFFSTTQTTMTPEPSLLLLSAGLLGLLPVARKMRRA